jgi:SHS2 domain-containing protein
MSGCRSEELGHTAEIGLRVEADAPETLYACAARGMFELLRVPPDPAQPEIRHLVSIDSIDAESLLVDWLSELLYLHETSGALLTDCTVLHWTPTHLEAEARGRPPSQRPAVHIKAATYHQLRVAADANGWTAQVYFDI